MLSSMPTPEQTKRVQNHDACFLSAAVALASGSSSSLCLRSRANKYPAIVTVTVIVPAPLLLTASYYASPAQRFLPLGPPSPPRPRPATAPFPSLNSLDHALRAYKKRIQLAHTPF